MDENLGTAILTPKNQIRLPDSIIELLKVQQSDVIMFIKKGNDIIIKKGRVVPYGNST